MRDRHLYQAGQQIVGLRSVGGQRCVLQAASSLADADRPAQVVADFGGEGGIPAVDGILNIAQDMREADLMLLARNCSRGWQKSIARRSIG